MRWDLSGTDFSIPGSTIHFFSDRYDSKDYKGKSSDIEVQFKGLIADFYVKDQSVKVKAAVSTRRGKGEYSVALHRMGIESILKIRKNW